MAAHYKPRHIALLLLGAACILAAGSSLPEVARTKPVKSPAAASTQQSADVGPRWLLARLNQSLQVKPPERSS